MSLALQVVLPGVSTPQNHTRGGTSHVYNASTWKAEKQHILERVCVSACVCMCAGVEWGAQARSISRQQVRGKWTWKAQGVLKSRSLKSHKEVRLRQGTDNCEGDHANWSSSGPRFVLRMPPRSWTLLLCHHPQNGGTMCHTVGPYAHQHLMYS